MLPISSDHEFFLIVTPGFEKQAALELAGWFPDLKAEPTRGGLTVHTNLSIGLSLNRCLKIPTRILVRAAVFGCKDFPKLYKKISGVNWAEWTADDVVVEFQASSHNSRLFIKKRIEKTCTDGRRDYLKKSTGGKDVAESKEILKAFVRFQDDVCTLSLDTSGERLHKRGLRPLSSEAPLRETLAAALLWQIGFGSGEADSIELVDPMTGGGTFLLEAAGLAHPVSSREFSNALRAPDAELSLKFSGVDPFKSFCGLDSSQKALESARKNLASTGDRRPLALNQDDIFSARPLPHGKKRWLIVNPPYGERIEIKGSLSRYYERLFLACEEFARPERALFILPMKINLARLTLPIGWVKESELPFANGGIPVFAAQFRRKS